jgi:carboxymethylenebutenolidase
MHNTIDITTASGTMKTELLIPDATGPFGAVLLFVDAGGLRPALVAIGQRIAAMGYLVAIPDIFFRSGSPLDILGPGAPRDIKTFESIFADPEKRLAFSKHYAGPAVSYASLQEDVAALIAALQRRSDFNGKIGTTGYCLGGNASLRVATLFGDQIAATASFHGGALATDQPDSPHLRVKDIKAKVYVAAAVEDWTFPDAAKAALITAFELAHVDARVETYAARHGFVVEDNRAYDAAASQRHDAALAAFFAANLQ